MEKVIARILDIEKQAKQIVSDARAQSGQLDAEVGAQLDAYRADCKQKAQEHIDNIRRTEWKDTEDELQRLGEEYRRKNADLDAWESRNFSRWLDELLTRARY